MSDGIFITYISVSTLAYSAAILPELLATNAHDITSLGVIAAPEMKISGVEVTPTNYLKKSGDIATYGGQQCSGENT